ncbi:uncharacterized [Tachysurus ichikawai]
MFALIAALEHGPPLFIQLGWKPLRPCKLLVAPTKPHTRDKSVDLAERDVRNQRSTIEFVHFGPAGLSTQPVKKMDAVVDEVKPAQPVPSSD